MEMKRGGRLERDSPSPPSVLINLDTRVISRDSESTETVEIVAYAAATPVRRLLSDVFTPGLRPEDRSPLLVESEDVRDRRSRSRSRAHKIDEEDVSD
jgi:hypothetical protein